MTHIEIRFTNDNVLNFDYEGEIDLHTINGHYMAFDDMLINLANVLFIRKKEADNETKNKI